ncbi:MAG: hypothetical protein ACYSUC_02215 [Planctomycetota bacterium]|jgi:hypothetical protein
MALLFFDGGGEYYDSNHIAQSWDRRAGTTVDGSGGRRGGAALTFAQSQSVYASFPEKATIYCGFAIKIPLLTFTNEIVFFRYGAVNHVNIESDIGGKVRVERGQGAGVFLAESGIGVLRQDTWHYMEIMVTIHNSTGAVIVRVDGNEVVNESNVDTQNASEALVNNVAFQFGTGSTQAIVDDFYILDNTGTAPQNTFLGDVQVDALLPTGTGTTSDFDTTVGSVTHYQNVDENPATADTDYNETPTANDVDLFTYPALTAITGGSTVVGVQALALARRTDLGYSNIQMVARPGVTNRLGTSTPLHTDYRYKRHIWDDDPDGGAWTESAVNNSEFGVMKP